MSQDAIQLNLMAIVFALFLSQLNRLAGIEKPYPKKDEILLITKKSLSSRIAAWILSVSMLAIVSIIDSLPSNPPSMPLALFAIAGYAFIWVGVATEQEKLIVVKTGIWERNVFYAFLQRRTAFYSWKNIKVAYISRSRIKGSRDDYSVTQVVFITDEDKNSFFFDGSAFKAKKLQMLQKILQKNGVSCKLVLSQIKIKRQNSPSV